MKNSYHPLNLHLQYVQKLYEYSMYSTCTGAGQKFKGTD